ncbi:MULTISPECIES: MarR family winged helix-turn-helix transcriptional regulator [Curtobacterium]|jgi:DNA-binding MarR family transcriptional regulator|uniref:MarR family transcriptional regulator n=1 Tax=Curtobacterium flaccumfaciens pv. flaccumfaciens TaxID=138532 RepID=A0A9Q2W561_9MICO|nr:MULTISPECIES: MarR family transcriptional regulator [Curtobacterium]MBT1541023.1 MarR family transcriptional regulator [Curtobacterium flaccumfaciens pv. flaccumfaciens]MBT1597684.1 MarR family transcriptional regulator [Curtobacterium flaccumfaciens pv. flaccumfaciens]MBT1620839.1 MarR family transcriptional regulator [Curtobacterium flaccumfaciens pv. poinsettiae]MCS6563964.1 MarR family transcriptional regulator [Curtobacterium flaccumfaciens pv. flaccumfaciens]MDD1385539.1 MarR family t
MEDTTEQWPLGRLLSAAARSVERDWDERLRAIGLSHAAVVAIDILIRTGPTGADTIARTARVQPQTMSRTLERMERDGLVERTPHAADRRRRVVSVTPAGRSAWETARHIEREVLPEDAALRVALREVLAKPQQD